MGGLCYKGRFYQECFCYSGVSEADSAPETKALKFFPLLLLIGSSGKVFVFRYVSLLVVSWGALRWRIG